MSVVLAAAGMYVGMFMAAHGCDKPQPEKSYRIVTGMIIAGVCVTYMVCESVNT